MLENTERVMKNGQSRETGNIGYTRRRKTKQKHNTIHYAKTSTNNVNKTISSLQTTRGEGAGMTTINVQHDILIFVFMSTISRG